MANCQILGWPATLGLAHAALWLIAAMFAASGCSAAGQGAPANVRTWPAPAGEEMSADFAVTVTGQDVPVYAVKIAPRDKQRRWKAMNDVANSASLFDKASFAYFDMNGPVTVHVTCPNVIRTAKVLPTSFGIVPKIDGKRLTLVLDKPRPLTLEVNGDWIGSLHILANPFEVDPPRPDDPNVIYFGPGIHSLPAEMIVGDGKTVYVAGGAVLRGSAVSPASAPATASTPSTQPTTRRGVRQGPVLSLRGKNITLRGRGIIDGSLCPTHTRQLLGVQGSDITIEGVILRDSSEWTLPIRQSDRVTVRNVKVFGYRANSDGIDICNSRDVLVEDCFLRTLDDLIVVKANGQGEVRRIVAKNCVLWNQVAHALSIGAELRDRVDDVLFTDCDVIHDIGREWTLRVYHCDSAVVSNVRFEHIRIEESPKLISLWIGSAVWSRDAERGHINDVTFKDITATTVEPLKVELRGFDADHAITGVTFQNVRINGEPLTPAGVRSNAFVSGVKVVGP